MKLLCIISSLDLTQPFSATPAWWQLLKGLYEMGADVLATTYQGPAIESLWWRALPNPVKRQGDLFKFAKDSLEKLRGGGKTSAKAIETGQASETGGDRLQRQLAQRFIAPRWQTFIDKTLADHPDTDAVIFFTIPLNHVVGLASHIQSKHQKPVFYYDGDLPASLPNNAGFSSGFKIYYGADLSEYTAFIGNSQGAGQTLLGMGAKAYHTLFYGVDTDVFSPLPYAPQQDLDVFFYGHSREYREIWIDGMIRDASNALPDAKFAVRGRGLGNLGRTQLLPYLSFSKLRQYACRSKINLCITRRSHGSVYASSTSRPFELASMAACIVANPYDGLDLWLEPEKEVIIAASPEEALARYQWLLKNEAARRALGEAARARVLAQHTAKHRAQSLLEIVKSYQ
jgi:glycosyltransferase involved in cell wall biosynthesis